MFKRKNRIIDKKFQLKTTFKIISISTIAFMVLITFIVINATKKNREINDTIREFNTAIEFEDNMVKSYINNSMLDRDVDFRINADKMAIEHDKSIESMKKFLFLLNVPVRQNFIVIAVIVVILLIQGVILYLFLIRLTHRISGPLYLITQHIKEIMEGREPNFRSLREKDEFKDLYEEFSVMTKSRSVFK